MADGTPFDFYLTGVQHTFHNIYEPVTFIADALPSKVMFGLTVAAEALPVGLQTKTFVRPWSSVDNRNLIRDGFPQMGRVDHLLVRGSKRPEVDHVSGWNVVEARLREAAARNRPKDCIFRGRELRLQGRLYHYGDRPGNDRLGITPDMLKLVLDKVTILD